MVDSGDGKHPDDIKRDTGANGGPTPANDKDPQAAQVQNDKGQAANPIDAVDIADLSRRSCSVIVGIEPLDKAGSYKFCRFLFH